MAKDITPAWQQVLLIALNNVPHREDGHDAWQKLSPDEQAAVTDFLSEHCGENAPAALEATCGKIKHPKWWVTFWAVFSLIIVCGAATFLLFRLQDALDVRVWLYLWPPLCLMNILSAWKGNPSIKAQTIWHERIETREGARAALDSMLGVFSAPRREHMQKGSIIFYAIMLVVYLLLIGLDLRDHRGPTVPQQVVSVLEDAADGQADMDAALQLFEPLEYGQAKEVLQAAWDKTPAWSDERYLAAALAARLGLENAADYAREVLLTTRLGAIDTPVESTEFSALLSLCDTETVQSVRARVEAAEFPEKAALLAQLDTLK